MKRITTAIFALTSLTSVQAAVDAFYSGAYLGMPIDDCIAYYLSGDPPIAERGHVTWDDPHAPPGQILVDFRTGKSLHPEKRSSEEVVERRVQVIYRESDRKSFRSPTTISAGIISRTRILKSFSILTGDAERAVSSATCTANTATASFSRSPPPSNISLRMPSVDRGPVAAQVLETLVVAGLVVGLVGC